MDVSDNANNYERLESPRYFKDKYPISFEARENVNTNREYIKNILDLKDKRRLFIVGPCSIHNFDEAIEYAKKLKKISDYVKSKILILMRVYLEKPRTIIGWKGFINDPDLNSSFNIKKGISLSRELLIKINEFGIPTATEFLDVLVYPYIYDLISWGAIGARTSESQIHRQMVSGFSIPIGFKNSTSGNIDIAINAIKSARYPHSFIGISEEGFVSTISTKGNSYCHLILRGSDNGPNYESEFVSEVLDRLSEESLKDIVMIDCSHGNSFKNYKLQVEVFRDVINQMKTNQKIIGLMLESNLLEGNQVIPNDLSKLKKGVSVTDGCISIETTERIIKEAYDIL
ncbi:MAG: 3-deoxy-7-phosphoheptulonate synthase [Candidatus Pacearchaeota archaeon]